MSDDFTGGLLAQITSLTKERDAAMEALYEARLDETRAVRERDEARRERDEAENLIDDAYHLLRRYLRWTSGDSSPVDYEAEEFIVRIDAKKEKL